MGGRFAACVSGADQVSECSLDEMTDEQWWNDLEANVFSQFLALKHAARAMRERSGGAFVALSSSAGDWPIPNCGSYSTSKAAVGLMMRVAADEMGDFGIRVNVVRTGLDQLTALSAETREAYANAYLARTPSGRIGSADEVARLVHFLVSDESPWITGECLRVDGGAGLRGVPRIAGSSARGSDAGVVQIGAPAATSTGIRGATALVTGGATSIGLATARVLARDGARVLIVGRTAASLDAACQAMRGEGLEVDWMSADVTDDRQVQSAVRRAMANSGQLDICVASAGVGAMSHLVDYDYERFQAPFRLNVVGSALTLKHASRAMTVGGSIVAVGSLSSVTPGRNLGAYGASKAGLDMLVRVAADELGNRGIRVNSVRPGLTKREAPSPIFTNPELMALYRKGFPLVRAGAADDSAFAIRYFAGPESAWTTGQCLTVDGGMSLRERPDLSSIGQR
jgi:NAD(P)-dependent dehydrogenase (short-subunit alcohol dehydrogenase family)